VPFTPAHRFFICEVAETGSGMGIDHTKCGRLFAQIMQDSAEHYVLEYVGEIPGMEFVPIVHNKCCQPRAMAR
jgi:hypothetical protein